MLMDAYPGGASQKDGYAGYPLHYVATSHTDRTILDIFRAYPEAAKERALNRGLPLHAVIRNRSSEEVVTKFLDMDPGAAKVADMRGRHPLHVALAKKVPYSTEWICRLYSIHEDAAKEKNTDGHYPLHLACINQGDPDLISKLIQLCPGPVKERRERG